MDIRISITAQGVSGKPLQLEVSGYSLEISGIAQGSSITISDNGGKLSVNVEGAGHPETVPVVAQEVATAQKAVPTVQQDVSSFPRLEAVPAQSEEQLFQQLTVLRKQIASEVKLPPYIIFHDSTLRDMCRALPEDLQALKDIQGVGEAKLAKYGSRFVEVIQQYTKAHEVGRVV